MTWVRLIVGVVAWLSFVGALAMGVLQLGEWRIAAATSIVLTGAWMTLYGIGREQPKDGGAK